MPRITVVTNRCNVCKATHRPNAEEDDSDRLENGVEDTELPEFWSEVTVRAKQPNPDFAENEARVRRQVEGQWRVAAQQAAQAKGAPLDSEDIEGLKEILEGQARGEDEPAELVVVEVEVLLCPRCTPLLTGVGLLLSELSAASALPSAWVPAVTPTPVVAVAASPPSSLPPPVSVSGTSSPQPVTPLRPAAQATAPFELPPTTPSPRAA